MATAEKIQFRTVESPTVLLRLVEKASDVQQSTNMPASPSKAARVQLTSQAPRLSVTPAKGDPSKEDYLEALAAYMEAVLVFTSLIAQNQSSVTQVQDNMGKGFIAGARAAAQKAMDDLQKAQAQQAKQKTDGLIEKIFGGLVMGLLAVIGAITGQIELVVMAVVMATMTYTGANDDINKYLEAHCGSVGVIFAKIGVAVAMAVVTCGLAGLAETAGPMLTSFLSRLFSSAAEDAVEDGAADAAGDAAADGAGEAADAAAPNVEEAEAEVSENAAQENEQQSFLSKVGKKGFVNGKGAGGLGKLWSQSAQMLMVFNPFTDLMKVSLKHTGLSDSTIDIISQVTGTVMALTAVIYTGRFTGEAGGPNFIDKLVQSLGESGAAKAQFGFSLAMLSSQIVEGGFGIDESVSLFKQAGITSDLADMRQTQTIYQGLIDRVSQMVSATQAGGKVVNDTMSEIGSRWDAFVEPYAVAAEVMG